MSPYLPESYQHQTTFPTAYGKDVLMQIRQVNEQYRRFFPLLEYYCLESSFQASGDAPDTVLAPIVEPNNTSWDPLYGESIDGTIAATGVWEQPHGDAVVGNSVNVEVFSDPTYVHGKVQQEVRDRELKKYGFDKMRDIIVTFPHAMLDELGITVLPGDEFIWDGDRYIVKQHSSSGYWKNTNLRMFRVCNCEQVREGS